MKKTVALLLALSGLGLTGCVSSHETSVVTNGTNCHQKFYNRAYNRPYEIKGITYHPQKHYEYSEVGIASFYGGGDVFHGRKTSNGETFDMNRLSAAHKTVPIPCVVLVTNLENGRSLKLKINDRGPFIDGRIIDVSRKAARMLGFENKGLAKVRVETLVQDSIILADNMARGSKGASPFESQTMLVQNDTHPASKKSSPKQLASHMVAQPGRASMKQPSHHNVNTSVYSAHPLPDIHLAAATTPHKGHVPSHQPAQRMPAGSSHYRQVSAPSKSQSALQHAVASKSPQPMAASKRGVYLQAGTYPRFVNAQSIMSTLKSKNPNMAVKMQPVKVGNKQMFRVLVGPFKDNGHAQMLSRQMRSTDGRMMTVVYE